MEISREGFVDAYRNRVEEIREYGLDDANSYTQKKLTEEVLNSQIGIQVLLNTVFYDGIEASEGEVTAKLQELVDHFGYYSVDHLVDSLIEQGDTRENIMLAASQQVEIEKVYAARTVPREPTEPDLQERYEAYLDDLRFPGSIDDSGLPSFDSVREELYAAAIQEHQAKEHARILDELRAASGIEIFI